jgi:hypothetical protein
LIANQVNPLKFLAGKGFFAAVRVSYESNRP